jgi:hypothetical protein
MESLRESELDGLEFGKPIGNINIGFEAKNGKLNTVAGSLGLQKL